MAKTKKLPVFLKSITVQGFKSFADRVKFELGLGLSVIVGPNGSGKSNVADAVRWVLGEQSIKSLRGTKMEDFIFIGTMHRRPVGMAEVTLVFDNSTGIFPLEFQEVTITRRMYRNGEGQFFINRVICRLKDIQELFMDTGAGKEGFSIIGQGRVEEILNSKSEDRRLIIEEAAGITKFRARKRETIKRLDDTEQNLLRVEDILQEIDTQLEPLAAQALLAEQSLELGAERQLLEVQLVVRNLAEVQEKLSRAGQDLAELKTGLSKAMAELAKTESKYLQDKLDLNQFEQKLQNQQNDVYNSEQTINSLAHDLNLRQERQSYLAERIKGLGQEISDENQRLSGLTDQIKALEDKQDTLKLTLEVAKNTLVEDEQKLKLAREANGTEHLEGLKVELFEILSEKANCSNEVKSIQQMIANFDNQLNLIKRESSQIVLSLETNRKLLDTQTNELLDLEKQEIIKREEETYLQIELNKIEKTLQENTLELTGFSRKADILGARWQALRTLEDSLEGYQRGVREIMLAKKQGVPACSSLCGTVAELLEVEEKLELAIETSLGGGLQNIITKTTKEANRAIAFLKNNQLGRATFLPLDVIQVNTINLSKEVTNDPGFVGIALDLVKFANNFRPAMGFLLGKIIIVQDMLSAARVASNTHYKVRIVTLEGDQVHPGGSLTGGSVQRKGGNLLARSREITELRGQLDHLELKLQDQKVICHELEADKQDIKDRLENLAKERKELSEKLLIIKVSNQSLEKQNKRWEEEVSLTNLRSKEVGKEQAEFEDKFQTSCARLEYIEQKSCEVRSELIKQEQQVKESAEGIEAQSERLTETKIRVAKWEQEFEQSAVMLVQEKFTLREKQKLLNQKKVDQNAFELDNNNLKQEIEVLTKSLKEKTIVQEKNLLALALLRQERESLTISLNDCEQILQTKRLTIQSFEQKIHVVELRLARWEADWETGTTRLTEEFSLAWNEAHSYLTDLDHQFLWQRIQEIKQQIEELGPINQASIEEYPKMLQRRNFLSSQHQDLIEANRSLRQLIAELDKTMSLRFQEGFEAVNEAFKDVFKELFEGGKAELRLVDPNDLLNSGVEIVAQPPWKKPQILSLLSGGERALTAIALLFALLRVKPSPFCILDEIEASLDDANVQRFAKYLRRLCDFTQFVVISHRKGTMEAADILYGITMEESGVSKLLSVQLDEREDLRQNA
ncbi:MAG: chromosome segregation protein SMC [Desulfitobacteriaceae bacterium]